MGLWSGDNKFFSYLQEAIDSDNFFIESELKNLYVTRGGIEVMVTPHLAGEVKSLLLYYRFFLSNWTIFHLECSRFGCSRDWRYTPSNLVFIFEDIKQINERRLVVEVRVWNQSTKTCSCTILMGFFSFGRNHRMAGVKYKIKMFQEWPSQLVHCNLPYGCAKSGSGLVMLGLERMDGPWHK